MYTLQFCFSLVHFKFRFFFQENSYFPCLYFSQWKKPYSKLISGIIFFIYQPIFKVVAAHFMTFGLQKGDMIIFFLLCSRKVTFRKRQFLKDSVWTVVCFISPFRLGTCLYGLPMSSLKHDKIRT